MEDPSLQEEVTILSNVNTPQNTPQMLSSKKTDSKSSSKKRKSTIDISTPLPNIT